MDPYGWSGTGNDPWIPGQGYGDLSAVRISILHGGQQDIKEGTLNEGWLPEYSGVSSIAVAGHRTGRISSGVPYVKDGQWNALWTQEYASASALVLSGRRIGILSGGQAYFKEGDLNQGWALEGSGVQEIAVTHNELGVTNPSRVGMRAGTYFFVKQGALGGTPTTVATNAKSIALGAGWIGYIDTNNRAWVKEGINDSWVWMQDNVSSLALGGAGADRRIGIIQNGVARVKEDSLYNTWVDEWTGVSKLTLNSGRIGVLTTSGLAKVKEGGLSDVWVDVYSGVSDLKLN